MKYFKNIVITGALLFLALSSPTPTLAVISCGGTCPGGIGDGDAALGVNFTGIQPSDLSAGSFVVSASNGGGFSCDYGSGIAGNSSSCTAYYNSGFGNIECSIEHLDCRNGAFDISVDAPNGYTCTVSPTSTTLANCFDNSPISVSCTPPAPTCATSCGACPGQFTCGNWAYQYCDTSPCSAAGATASTNFTCWANPDHTGCSYSQYTCNSCAPSYVQIAGTVRSCTTGTGLSGVNMSVYDNNLAQTKTGPSPTSLTTNSSGSFWVDSFVRSGDYYAVNYPPSAPQGYQNPPLTNAGSGVSSYQNQNSALSPNNVSNCLGNCDFCYNPTTQNPPPTVTCSSSPNPTNSGATVTWIATSAGGTAPYSSYSWRFDDGTTSTTTPATATTSTTTKNYTNTSSTNVTKTAYVKVTDSVGQISSENSCTVQINPPFAYTLFNGGDRSVTQSSSTTNTITVNLGSGTTQNVTLSVPTACASGVTCSLSPTSGNPTYSSTLTITASSTATTGTFPITVTGTSSGVANQTTKFNLTVNPTLSIFDYSLKPPTDISVTQGQ